MTRQSEWQDSTSFCPLAEAADDRGSCSPAKINGETIEPKGNRLRKKTIVLIIKTDHIRGYSKTYYMFNLYV